MTKSVRLPPIQAAAYTDEQRAAADQYVARRGHEPSRPYRIMLRSPEVMKYMNEVGVYLTYHSPLSGALFEFACLMVARDWGSDYVWNVHQLDMENAGIFNADIASELRQGRRPRHMSEDEEIVYDFLIELQRHRSVSDYSYERALKRFGEKGVIDLMAINALYSMLSMTANVARVPLPFDGAVPLPHFPD